MQPYDYDLKLAKTIKALRQLHKLDIENVAKALSISNVAYYALENGKQAITTGQLKKLAEVFNSNLFEILAIAQADECIDFKSTGLDEILFWFGLWNAEKIVTINLPAAALAFVVSSIKSSYHKRHTSYLH